MHIVLVFFFPFGWVLLGIQGIDKGIKKCFTLGSLNTVLGIYKLWYGVLSTSRGRQYSIMDTFHTLHESRVPVEHFRTLEVCRLEYFAYASVFKRFMLRMSLVFQPNTTEHLKCVVTNTLKPRVCVSIRT